MFLDGLTVVPSIMTSASCPVAAVEVMPIFANKSPGTGPVSVVFESEILKVTAEPVSLVTTEICFFSSS
ncbi:hypothetical protein D3C74_495160 [compost metagenome]